MTTGRTQEKFVETIVLDTLNRKYVSRLPRDFYLAGFRLTFRGRERVTAAATTVMPEGILNLVERLRLNVNHRVFKAQTLLDAYGPTWDAYRRFYNAVGLRQVDVPLTITTSESDYVFILDYQFSPENIFPADQRWFELDAPFCSQADLEIEWGDAAGPIEGGTTSLSNFGGTTGSPEVDVHVFQVLDREDGPHRSLVKRVASDVAMATAIGGAGSNNIGRLILAEDFPVGETIRSLLLKQYVRSTTAGQAITVVATLRDPIEPGVDAGVGSLALRVSERPIRHWSSWQELRQQNQKEYRSQTLPLGYAMIDFATIGNIDRSLFTADFPERRMRLDLAASVVAATDQRLEKLFTTILENPNLVAAAA